MKLRVSAYMLAVVLAAVTCVAQSPKPAPPAPHQLVGPQLTELERIQIQNMELRMQLLNDEQQSIPAKIEALQAEQKQIPQHIQALQAEFGAFVQNLAKDHPGYVFNPQQMAFVFEPKAAPKPTTKGKK